MENNKSKNKAEKNYPGVAINQADDEKTSKSEVKERTKVLGCNPRNSK